MVERALSVSPPSSVILMRGEEKKPQTLGKNPLTIQHKDPFILAKLHFYVTAAKTFKVSDELMLPFLSKGFVDANATSHEGNGEKSLSRKRMMRGWILKTKKMIYIVQQGRGMSWGGCAAGSGD